jgi:hypothetical protein
MNFNQLPDEIKNAAIGLIAAGLFALTSWLKSIKFGLLEVRTKRAIFDAAEIYDILNEVSTELNASRVLISKSHNGTGLPESAKELKMSVLYEQVSEKGARTIREDFQNVPADKAFVRILRDVISASWEGSPEQLEDGILKDFCLADGVKYIHKVAIGQASNGFFLLCVRWNHLEDIPDAAKRREVLRSAAQKIHEKLR